MELKTASDVLDKYVLDEINLLLDVLSPKLEIDAKGGLTFFSRLSHNTNKYSEHDVSVDETD